MGTIIIKPLLHVYILHLFFFLAFGTDTIYPGQSISLDCTITSKNGVFQISFCQGDSYISIQYNKDPHLTVWTGNIRNPFSINSSQHVLSIHNYLIIWSNRSSPQLNFTKLVLEDNGNLVLKSISDPNTILWQNFDHPTDTWLPGVKVGFNKLTNTQQVYTSGEFSFKMDLNTMSSIAFEKHGFKHGSCQLKGTSLSCLLKLGWYGQADMLLFDHTTISYVSNENETYFMNSQTGSSSLTQIMPDRTTGLLSQVLWLEESQIWMSSKWRLADAYCDQFAVYNHKRDNLPNCTCFSTTECANKSPFQCHDGTKEGFLLIHNATLPSNDGFTLAGQGSCKMPCMQDCDVGN